MNGPPVVKSKAGTAGHGPRTCGPINPSARAELTNPRPSPKVVAIATASGIPRHFPDRMIYPLIRFRETLLGCRESSERQFCPSLPTRGRLDRPRAVTDHARAARAAPSWPPDPFRIATASTVMPHRPFVPVEARYRPQSVIWPCLSPSVRARLVLERKDGGTNEKRTSPTLKPVGPVQSFHRGTPWHAETTRKYLGTPPFDQWPLVP